MTKKNKLLKKHVEEDIILRSLKNTQFPYSNIIIKSLNIENKNTSDLKKKKRITQKLNQLETKRDKFTFLRDEQNNNTKILFNNSNKSKSTRDEINQKIRDLKLLRNKNYQERDQLMGKKSELENEIKKLKDKETKSAKIMELKDTKKIIFELHTEAQQRHSEIEELSIQSQESHEDMLVYKMLANQSKKSADNYHKDFVQHCKEIRKTQSNLRYLENKYSKP